MSKFKTLLHNKVSHHFYNTILLRQLNITKTKLSRIENNPGEIDLDLMPKVAKVLSMSVHVLYHEYKCGTQVLSAADAVKLGLVKK